ncbi:MAG TPA: nucleotide exchange factor GrpE [Opitutaceae bacterium]|nr:nucleotide exchange factor GrpE [Opitutaceae bacterium]
MSESETQSPPTPPGPEPAAAKNPSAGATGDQPAGKATAGDGSAAVAPAGAALEEQLATAKKEAAGNYDHYLRALADLENFRRRAIREKEELRQFASVNLLQSLLPILDNLQLGLAAARQQTDTKTVVDGVAMVLEQLKGVLLHHGLKEVNPVGQKFDPHLHESISHQASPDVPEEHVLQVVRIGYTLHGRLLRAASVVLSSGPAKKEAS